MANQKTLKKTKTIVGGVKAEKRARKILLSVACFGIVAIIGFLGYSMYKSRSLKAQAARWTIIFGDGAYTVKSCKISTIYGTFAKVVFEKPSFLQGGAYSAQTHQWNQQYQTLGSMIQRNGGTAWWAGQVAAFDLYAGNSLTTAVTAELRISGQYPKYSGNWRVYDLEYC